MARLLAEQLLLLCWDDDKGKVDDSCAMTLPTGIGGALVLDALRADALTIRDGRIVPTGSPPSDSLLAEVVAEATRRSKPLTVKSLVERTGTTGRPQQVRARLVDAGILRPERRRVFGVFPTTRYLPVDADDSTRLRASVRSLLVGAIDPAEATIDEVLLAMLASPTGAVEVLVERTHRKQAHVRADAFAHGQGVPESVKQVVQEAQLAFTAIIAGNAAIQSTTNT